MPGAPYKLSATPWKLTKSSPGLGKLGQVSPVEGEALAVALSHDGAAQ